MRGSRVGAVTARPEDFEQLSARDLLTRMELSLEELQRRGIVRSRNAPLADVSERIVWIAREAERWSLSP